MKKILLFLISFLFFTFTNVYAEEFTNLNYLDWVLRRQDDVILNSGTTPFLTSYLGSDYPNSKLILDYTNYTFYPGYYYDVTFQYFFENKNDMGSQNFVEGVTDCYIYPWQSNSYTVDSCEIVSKTSTSFKVRATNLRTSSNSAIAIRLTNTFNFNTLPTELVYVQLNSYILNIVRKDNTGISEDTFDDGVNNIINNQNSNTNSIVNNQNSSTNTIVNNQNSNTNSIINNQNSNTDKEIESQEVCSKNVISKDMITISGNYINTSGQLVSSNSWGVTDFLKFKGNIDVISRSSATSAGLCFYDSNKTLISCISNSSMVENTSLNVPNNSIYIRLSINNNDVPKLSLNLCQNGNQALNDNINDLQDTLNDDSIDSSSSTGFFSNFSTSDNGGISSVITAPLSFVRSLTNSCSPISFTIFDETITIPCGDTLFWGRSDVESFRDIWNIIVGGAFVYMLLSQLFKTIESMKDPQSDKVEVMKL